MMMLMTPWIVFALAAVLAAVWVAQRRDEEPDDEALKLLDQRLSAGELTVAEHAQRREALQERRGRARPRFGRWGGPVAILAALAVGVLLLGWLGTASWAPGSGMGGHMGWRGETSSNAQAVEDAREVTIEAGELWFDPASVEVTVGEPVNLRLVNTGEAFHDLTVPAADVVLAADPGEEDVGAIEFTEPGRYEFSCSVPGHARGGMRGTIVVTDAA